MKRMTKKDKLEQARRYESAWHYLFYQLSDFQQQDIIEDPSGRVSKELTQAVIKLAEGDDKIPAVKKKVGKTS